ncbi:kinase-like protein [Leucogyrophana mollusca]|uniref:Kinase-like protein n=1 Tax=Leucogyrophana mollusca TaxID=85980 RepID=A0ACB8BB39_9AGAM|nr:kinase-like protein [Leucogyrophana mollusca]
MVDLLNALLEESAISKDLKNLFADTLVKLCRHSCRFPACLILNDITVDADNQVVTGGYSQVSRGQIQGQPIAMKQVTLYMSRMEVMMKACAREAIIWSRLSHPNLLPFYGIFYLANDRSRISLVSPWIEHGHIGQYLERFPQTDREPLAMDIAQGIEYLHTCLPTIVHGDLKPVRYHIQSCMRVITANIVVQFNIFVTPSGTACLADFGLAYAKDPQRRTATSTQGPAHGGTYPYEAPELLLNEEPVSFAGDVYAFACVLYEMYSGMQPFHLQTVARVILALTAGERPARCAEVNDAMWGLIERCWHQDPAQRPSASDVVRYLGSFAAVDEQRRQHQ